MSSPHSVARACAVLILSLGTVSAAPESHSNSMPIAGWLERARLSPGDVVLEAKLDTGAYTSSLHAMNLQRFEREGRAWVAFEVRGNDGRSARIERPIIRTARIRSALGTDAGRPTVTLGICVGSVFRVTEVNLVDRSNLSKPLLIGRRFLSGQFLVDLSRSHVLEPACTQTALE